jgi:Flp pilus assembly protein TadG
MGNKGISTKFNQRDEGATAMLVAACLLLLIGMAAIAVDLGAGFNERRENQSTADVSVMAGALEASFFGSNQKISEQALLIARQNFATAYGNPAVSNDPIWVELWRSCQDSPPVGYFPLPEPANWAGVPTPTTPTGTLECISRSASFLRVRVPDQTVKTTFGNVLGVSGITTNAVAVAILDNGESVSPVVPYGIAGGTGNGESCFGNAPAGTSFPPCTGPSSGTFGTLLSEFFGDFYGVPNCGNPGATEIAAGTALGIDHFLGTWTAGTVSGAHPGDNYVLNTLPDTNRDACDLSSGAAVAVDATQLNTVKVDSGFPSNAMQRGMVSDEMFFGRESRLQQEGTHDGVTNATREIVARRVGANEDIWELDNVGPWEYLVPSASGACYPANYTGTTADKIARFNSCLAEYTSSGSTAAIFTTDIDQSPRFAWAPQYWYDLPTTGLSWEPVKTYRMVFIAGTWFNCSAAGTCGVVFYPDSDEDDELCDPSGKGNCKVLNMSQFSAWVLPYTAIPPEVSNSFPGGHTPALPTLWR